MKFTVQREVFQKRVENVFQPVMEDYFRLKIFSNLVRLLEPCAWTLKKLSMKFTVQRDFFQKTVKLVVHASLPQR